MLSCSGKHRWRESAPDVYDDLFSSTDVVRIIQTVRLELHH
ncbi:hypothetical protein [Azotobacter chroococcum]|nr:hypothetical protein [Azotobacter chroococcum]